MKESIKEFIINTVIIVVVVGGALFGASLIWEHNFTKTDSDSVSSSQSKDEETAGEASEKSEESASLGADRNLGNVITGTVEITIPSDMFDDDFDYTLTEEDKTNGFTKIQKNSDGSATYTIKKKDYNKYIKKIKQETQNTLDSLATDGTYKSIKDIEYSKNFETVTIIADKEQFENGFDGFSIMACGLSACLYQNFDVDVETACTVEVKDYSSGEIFNTQTYPQ